MTDQAARLSDLTWPELAGGETVVLPLGSLEQHGPHLPLDTDTTIALAVAERMVAALRAEGEAALLAPPLPFGSSGEHQSFPGTISLGTEALTHVIVEIGRSVLTWAGRLVLVSGHGGNLEGVRTAVDTLTYEGRDVIAVFCRVVGGDAHAGRTETSVMLHLDPARTHLDRAQPGAGGDLSSLWARIRAEGVRAVSDNGVLGDPKAATVAEGDSLTTQMVELALSDLSGALGPGDRDRARSVRIQEDS